MSTEAIATIITAAFLLWAWHAARTPGRHRAEAERIVDARPSSWEQSAEGQMHTIQSGMNRSQPPY